VSFTGSLPRLCISSVGLYHGGLERLREACLSAKFTSRRYATGEQRNNDKAGIAMLFPECSNHHVSVFTKAG
jgi:hypothetical protein